MKKYLLLIVLLLNTIFLFSQTNYSKCNTTKLVNSELRQNIDYFIARNQSKELNNNITKNTINIPIVIHIIHRNTHSNIGTGTNISDAQIEDQLRILNEDYSKTNPEFPNPPRNTFVNYAGNPNLKFCLATIDPDGNPTNGITRTSTTQLNWDADDDSNNPCHEANGMKKTACGGKDGWDPYKYLNIWVCDLTNSQSNGMTLGYAYLPGLLANPFNTSDDYKDGLVVDYRYFGSIGVAAPSSDGRTATHEIGHYLGLMHTFCEQTDSQGNMICCDNDDNIWGGFVDDTPAVQGIYFGPVNSNTNNNTCNDLSYSNTFNTNVLDMDENYMSYATNTWMFSQGQVDVMLGTLNTVEISGGRFGLQGSDINVNCSGTITNSNNLLPNLSTSIYPNPSKGYIYVNTTENINAISITNLLGKEIKSNIESNVLNLLHIDNGIYFINIKTDKGSLTKRIILSK